MTVPQSPRLPLIPGAGYPKARALDSHSRPTPASIGISRPHPGTIGGPHSQAGTLGRSPSHPDAIGTARPHPRLIGFGPKVPRRGNAFSQWLGLLMLRLLGGWRVRGHWPDLPKAVVIVAPHTSNMDGVLSVAAILALRLRLSFFMKHSAFPWLLAGLIRWFGGVPVNRTEAHDLVSASAEQFAAHEQLLIAITPDGTRHAPEQWKKGFYWIAHRAQVPIICVGYDYARREIVIRETLTPSGDYEKDYPLLLAQFRGIAPRHPARLSRPLRELRDR